jgi:pyrroline-5-carboxylate reductase
MKITFLGGGNMANAMIGGLVKTGFSAADIAVIELGAQGRAKLRLVYGVRCYEAPTAAALDCDAVLLSVKPQQLRDACEPLLRHLKQQLIISIAAGLRLADVSRWLGGYGKIVRAMPNTPALIGAGVTGLYALPAVSMAERLGAERILQAVGSTLWIADEAQMDAVTAISGSGPAYVFLFIEALQQAASELGTDAGTGASAFDRYRTRGRQAGLTVRRSGQRAARARDFQRRHHRGGTAHDGRTRRQGRFHRRGLAANTRGRELGELLGGDS